MWFLHVGAKKKSKERWCTAQTKLAIHATYEIMDFDLQTESSAHRGEQEKYGAIPHVALNNMESATRFPLCRTTILGPGKDS